MLIGAHVPITGGLHHAPATGRAVGAEAIQVFTRNQVQWSARPLADAEVEAFRDALRTSGVRAVLAHGSYLVNLASPLPEFLEKSRRTFLAEIERCHRLGIPYFAFHPGAHMGAGADEGVRAVARSLDWALERAEGLAVTPLLEATAGQGTTLGSRFQELAAILDHTRQRDRLGVCLDTCHLLAAGYDLIRPEGHEAALADFARIVGFERLKALHLNDAKCPLGSGLDRHAPIGRGCLGFEALRRLVNEPRFQGLPAVVETPGPLAAWKREIAFLKRLRGTASVPAGLRAPARPRPERRSPARPDRRSPGRRPAVHDERRARAAR
jgi:deoxyribonuclease-4